MIHIQTKRFELIYAPAGRYDPVNDVMHKPIPLRIRICSKVWRREKGWR